MKTFESKHQRTFPHVESVRSEGVVRSISLTLVKWRASILLGISFFSFFCFPNIRKRHEHFSPTCHSTFTYPTRSIPNSWRRKGIPAVGSDCESIPKLSVALSVRATKFPRQRKQKRDDGRARKYVSEFFDWNRRRYRSLNDFNSLTGRMPMNELPSPPFVSPFGTLYTFHPVKSRTLQPVRVSRSILLTQKSSNELYLVNSVLIQFRCLVRIDWFAKRKSLT